MRLRSRVVRVALVWALGWSVAGAPAVGAEAPATVSMDDVRAHPDGRHQVVVSVLDASGRPVAGLENAFGATVDGAGAEALTARSARQVRPTAVVSVVADASLFEGSTIADVKEALLQLAAELSPNDRLRVIAAGAGTRALEVEARSADKLGDRLASLHDNEPARLYDALAGAVRESSRLPSNRGAAVLVLTRGTDGGSRRGAVEVIALARARSRLTPVLVILLGDRGHSPEAERLRRLAANAGGAFTEASSAYGLGPVMAGLAKRGLDLWLLDFAIPGWKRAEPKHHLGVTVEQGGTRRAAETDYDTADVLPPPWWSGPLPWLLLGTTLAVAVTVAFLARRRQRGLLVHDGDDWDGVWYELFAFPVSIGGAGGNDLVLADEKVSRNHALLERRGRTVELIDLNSENGSFVNGERIQRRALADGDRISIGPAVHLIYEARG